MFVTNDISEDITVHVTSRRDDRGNITLPFQATYDWDFCETGQIVYAGQFWWGSKGQIMNLYDTEAWEACNNHKLWVTQHCYWLVRPEGFYIGRENVPFPSENWQFKKPW